MNIQGISAFNEDVFANYLSSPVEEVLDLSNLSVLEIIDKMCEFKESIHPGCTKRHSSIKYQLKLLENRFGTTLMPNQVTEVFWNLFVSFLINESKLALSTIKTDCHQLRTALSWASRFNAIVSPSYDYVALPKYCHEQIALTPDEVSHIYHFNINSIPRRRQYRRNMERVKDMLVLSCNLGQRFSDMVRIDKTCFDRNIFTILQQKTGCHARVDIERHCLDRNTVYRILEKYNFRAPITGDISAHDRYIKQLLQYIGGEFNEEIKQETKINGIIQIEYKPKWRLVSSHTGRRTFATVNVLRGIPEAEIRRATGHKSSSAFEKYLCYYD